MLQKQNEIAGFRVNRTENSMKSKMEKAKKKLDEMKKKKIVQVIVVLSVVKKPPVFIF